MEHEGAAQRSAVIGSQSGQTWQRCGKKQQSVEALRKEIEAQYRHQLDEKIADIKLLERELAQERREKLNAQETNRRLGKQRDAAAAEEEFHSYVERL